MKRHAIKRRFVVPDPVRWLVPGLVLFFYSWISYKRYIPPLVSLVHLAVFALLYVWGVWKVARRERLPRSPLAWPLLALLGATTLATIFSRDPRISYDGLLPTLVLVLFFFLFCDLLLSGWRPRTLVAIVQCVATLALFAGLWSVGEHFLAWWQVRVAGYPTFLFEYRLFDVIDHPNLLAALINLALPFAIVSLAQARHIAARLAWSGWLVAFVVLLHFTRSRGGMLAAGSGAAVAVVGLMVLRGGVPWRVGPLVWLKENWRIWTTTLVFAALFGLLLFGPELAAQLQSANTDTATTTETTSEFTTSSGSPVRAASGRMAFWGVAWHAFQQQPLTGTGPRTYGYTFVEEMHNVRFWLTAHAHSLYFDLLGSTGIVGIAAFAWVVLAGLVTFVRRAWAFADIVAPDAEEREHALLLIGVCAALAGFLVHSLVDVPNSLPTISLFVVLLSAVGMHAAGALTSDNGPLSRWTGAVLVAPLVLAFVLVQYHTAQQAMFTAVLHGLRHDWPAAAHAMDQAVAADPNFAFYHGQRGYAYSYLAAPVGTPNDTDALQQALESYAHSSAMEPPYLPNLLNTALLLEEAGLSQQAEQVLEQAVALPHARGWALPFLLLADRAAAQGDQERADALFATAFKNEAHAPDMAACRRSAACQHAASTHDDGEPSIHETARALLAQGQPQQALDALADVPVSNDDPLFWLDRTHAYLALGQTDAATYALQVADTLRSMGNQPESDAYAALTHATFALAQDNPTQALRWLEQAAYPSLSMRYNYGLFHRVGLPGLLQPRLDLLQRTADDLAVYQQLATLYDTQGDTEGAAWARTQADMLAGWLETGQELEQGGAGK